MINPKARARRLKADFDRVKALHDLRGLFAIEGIGGDPPEQYIIRFTCRGIARIEGDRPIYSDLHRVRLTLTDSYPDTPPIMEWLTPVFHPNIRPDGQGVCIGEWYPAKTLDQLVIMLGEMVQYQLRAGAVEVMATALGSGHWPSGPGANVRIAFYAAEANVFPAK